MSETNKKWCLYSGLALVVLVGLVIDLYYLNGIDEYFSAGLFYPMLVLGGMILLPVLISLIMQRIYENFSDYFDLACNVLGLIGIVIVMDAKNFFFYDKNGLVYGKFLFVVCCFFLIVDASVLCFHLLGRYTVKEKEFITEEKLVLDRERESRRIFDQAAEHKSKKNKNKDKGQPLRVKTEYVFTDVDEVSLLPWADKLYARDDTMTLDRALVRFMRSGSCRRPQVLLLSGGYSSGKSAALLDAVTEQLSSRFQLYELPVYIDLYDWLVGTPGMLEKVARFHKRIISGQKEKARRELLTDMFRVYYEKETFSTLLSAGCKTRFLFIFDGLEDVVGWMQASNTSGVDVEDLVLSLYDLAGQHRCILSFCSADGELDALTLMKKNAVGHKRYQMVTLETAELPPSSAAELPYDTQRLIRSNITMTRIYQDAADKKAAYSKFELLDRFVHGKIITRSGQIGYSREKYEEIFSSPGEKLADFCIETLIAALGKDFSSASPYTSFPPDRLPGAHRDDLIALLDGSDLIAERENGELYISSILIYEYLAVHYLKNRPEKAMAFVRSLQLDTVPIHQLDEYQADILAMLLEETPEQAPVREEVFRQIKALKNQAGDEFVESVLYLAEKITRTSMLLDGLLQTPPTCEDSLRSLLMWVRAFHLKLRTDQAGAVKNKELADALSEAVFRSGSLHLQREWLRTVSSLMKEYSLPDSTADSCREFLLQEFPNFVLDSQRGWREEVLPEKVRDFCSLRRRDHKVSTALYVLVLATLAAQVVLLAVQAFASERFAPTWLWGASLLAKLTGLVVGGMSFHAWCKQLKSAVYVYGGALMGISDLYAIDEYLAFIGVRKSHSLLLCDWLSNRPSIVFLLMVLCDLLWLPVSLPWQLLLAALAALLMIPLSSWQYIAGQDRLSLAYPILLTALYVGLCFASASLPAWGGLLILLATVILIFVFLLIKSWSASKLLMASIRVAKDSAEPAAIRDEFRGLSGVAGAQLLFLYVLQFFNPGILSSLKREDFLSCAKTDQVYAAASSLLQKTEPEEPRPEPS